MINSITTFIIILIILAVFFSVVFTVFLALVFKLHHLPIRPPTVHLTDRYTSFLVILSILIATVAGSPRLHLDDGVI
jgi:hypothetical protein